MFRTSAACAACCLAAGCIATDAVYPAGWAGRMKAGADGCPSIDGEYSNQGDMSQESDLGSYAVVSGSVSLADILAGQAEGKERFNFTTVDATSDAFRSVELRVAGKTLHVLAHRTDGDVRAVEVALADDCSGSMIDAGASWDGTTMLLASSIDRSGMKLGRAVDGSLVIRTKRSTGWAVTYKPIFAVRDKRWLQFPAYRPRPANGIAAGGR